MSDVTTPMSQLMQGVIPYVALENADDAVAFYKHALGAVQHGDIYRDDQGRILNVTLEVNGGAFMLLEHMPEFGEPSAKGSHGFTLQIVSADGEAFFRRAIAAGCTETMPFEKQFWGDRYGRFADPFGLAWAVDEPSPESLAANA